MRIDRLLLVLPVEQTLRMGNSVFSPHQSQIWVINKNEVNPLAGQTYVDINLCVCTYVGIPVRPLLRRCSTTFPQEGIKGVMSLVSWPS